MTEPLPAPAAPEAAKTHPVAAVLIAVVTVAASVALFWFAHQWMRDGDTLWAVLIVLAFLDGVVVTNALDAITPPELPQQASDQGAIKDVLRSLRTGSIDGAEAERLIKAIRPGQVTDVEEDGGTGRG